MDRGKCELLGFSPTAGMTPGIQLALSDIVIRVGLDIGYFFRESQGGWADRGRSEKRSRAARLQQRQYTIGCAVFTPYRPPTEAANCLCIPVPALQGLALSSHPSSKGSSCCVE
jgi:hypothetical protein